MRTRQTSRAERCFDCPFALGYYRLHQLPPTQKVGCCRASKRNPSSSSVCCLMTLLHRSLVRSARRIVAPPLLWATLCRATTSSSSATPSSSSSLGDHLSSASFLLPSSLQGPPICELVPPRQCQFTHPDRTAVPLLERIPVSSTSSILRFGLPNSRAPLNLSTCACLLAHANANTNTAGVMDGTSSREENEETVVTRPYTPISTNRQLGSFDLLIKNYGPTSQMSRHLHEIPIGATVQFSHGSHNVKVQAPFLNKEGSDYCDFVGMLAGGTGVSPMIQALHALLGDPNCHTKVCLLYGSRVANDILAHELLHQWAAQYPDRFQCVDVLSHEPIDSDWMGRRGWIDRALLEEYFPPAVSSTVGGQPSSLKIFVCGPPPMYDALSGPRHETDHVKGILGDMGYTPEQVYKF